jgi:uncharacterized protein (TIGR03545 family)
MRKKFIYFALIPAIIVCIVVYIFLDSWIELALEYGGERAVGSKVEIDNLHVTLNPISVEFSRMQVANPINGWKNLFETGNVKFSLNFGQLLRGKYIVETMEVNNVILGTKRTTDGASPKYREEALDIPLIEQAKSALMGDDSKSSVSFDLDKIKRELNIDKLLDPNNLATYRRIDTLKKQISDASVQWKTTLEEIDKSKAKLADIETRAKAIDINNIKTVQAASEALNNANSILTNANDIRASFQTQKNVLTNSVDNFGKSIKDIDDIVTQDFKNILNMAHLPDLSMKSIAEMTLGKELLQKAYEYLGYVEMAKSRISNSTDKPPFETPARFKGQNIHFPVEQSYPKYWIKKVLISGGTDKTLDPQYFYAKGEVHNITDNQRITGFPLTVDLSATKAGSTSLTLGASIDRRKDLSLDNYKAQLTGLPIQQMSLGRSDFLPSKIIDAIADASIDVTVPGSHFDSNTKIFFNNLSLVFDREPNGIVERIVHDVLSSVKGFNVDLHIWQNENKFDVAFATDLDDQLASQTKRVIGNEVMKIQNDLRNKLNAKIAEKRAELEKLYNEKREMVMSKVKEYEIMANEKLVMVEAKKKEIEDRIEQEKKKQTDDVTKKAKDALKDILK